MYGGQCRWVVKMCNEEYFILKSETVEFAYFLWEVSSDLITLRRGERDGCLSLPRRTLYVAYRRGKIDTEEGQQSVFYLVPHLGYVLGCLKPSVVTLTTCWLLGIKHEIQSSPFVPYNEDTNPGGVGGGVPNTPGSPQDSKLPFHTYHPKDQTSDAQ